MVVGFYNGVIWDFEARNRANSKQHSTVANLAMHTASPVVTEYHRVSTAHIVTRTAATLSE